MLIHWSARTTSLAYSHAENSWQKISSNREEVVDLAAGDSGHRLIEHGHAVLDVALVHQARSGVGQGHDLEVDVAGDARGGDGTLESLVLALAVGLEHPERQRDPSLLTMVGLVTHQRLGTRQPPVHHRPVADDHAVHSDQSAGDGHDAHTLTFGPVAPVRGSQRSIA